MPDKCPLSLNTRLVKNGYNKHFLGVLFVGKEESLRLGAASNEKFPRLDYLDPSAVAASVWKIAVER